MSGFNKQNLANIRTDVEAALAGVAEKYGAKIELGTIRFSEDEFRAKITGTRVKSEKEAEKESFVDALSSDLPTLVRESARATLLPAILQDRTFMIGRKKFVLTGVKKSRPKYPFQGVGPQGGNYKFTVDQVANGIV